MGLAKNLKRHEWAHIIAKMDDLKTRGVVTRVKVAGSLVSAEKIKQQRRRYLKKMPASANTAEPLSRIFPSINTPVQMRSMINT